MLAPDIVLFSRIMTAHPCCSQPVKFLNRRFVSLHRTAATQSVPPSSLVIFHAKSVGNNQLIHLHPNGGKFVQIFRHSFQHC